MNGSACICVSVCIHVSVNLFVCIYVSVNVFACIYLCAIHVSHWHSYTLSPSLLLSFCSTLQHIAVSGSMLQCVAAFVCSRALPRSVTSQRDERRHHLLICLSIPFWLSLSIFVSSAITHVVSHTYSHAGEQERSHRHLRSFVFSLHLASLFLMGIAALYKVCSTGLR